MKEIADMLTETGLYQAYRKYFMEFKLPYLRGQYSRFFFSSLHSSFLRLIRESLTEDDRQFYRSKAGNAMSRRDRWFYRGIVDGDLWDSMKYRFFDIARLTRYFVWKFMRRPLGNKKT